MQVGDRFKVTHRLYAGGHLEVVVESVAEGVDPCYNIRLSITTEVMPGERVKRFERNENTVVVEPNWFDPELTGRKITKL